MFWLGIFIGFAMGWIVFALLNAPDIARAQEIIRRQKELADLWLKAGGAKP
jgi:hypothetical protein